MEKSAVLHIPLSQYAFPSKEKELTIRIRTKKKDLTGCTLYYGDRACNHTPVDFYPLDMYVCGENEFYDYYEAKIVSEYSRICYYFKLEDEQEWTYYYADQFTNELADITIDGKMIEGRSEYFQYPFILRDEVIDVPEWFKNAIVYNIFPDSFASGTNFLSCEEKTVQLDHGILSRSRLGGTIGGIKDNLDYIQGLGFNCIYLNPIFVAGESHKYDLLDYYHIDPCFGTEEEFRELVHNVHEKGMHIIIDGVFNHCSWEFFAFEDVISKGENSIYKDWFYDLSFPVSRPEHSSQIPSYACFAYERKMPKLNTSNLQVQEYFANVGKYWIREFHIDGWRLDVANEIDRNFWRTFRKATKEENKDIVLIGEVWENSETWLRGDAFDSTMNYDFRKHCRDFFALDKINGETFAWRVNQMLLRYPTNITNGQLNLLDSHDVPRFLSLCKEDIRRWKLAFLFLLFAPGVPSVFYGDEKGISGITEKEYRRPMVWKDYDETLMEFVKQTIQIRAEYIEYHSEYKYNPIMSDHNLFCFSRSGEKGTVMIYLNVGEKEYKLTQFTNHTILMEEGIDNNVIQSWGYGVYLT